MLYRQVISNVDRIQVRESVIIGVIVDAYRHPRIDDVNRDLRILFVNEDIGMIAAAHEKRLHQHVYVEAAKLFGC